MKLQDKVAIVTGSSKGIGKGIAHAFSAEGAKIVVTCRTQSEGEVIAEELGLSSGRALFVRTDVTRSENIRNMIDLTMLSTQPYPDLVRRHVSVYWQNHEFQALRLRDFPTRKYS